MFDSHIHLDFPELKDALVGHFKEAKEAGITAWLVPGCHREQWDALRELSSAAEHENDEIHFAVGQHPYWSEGLLDLDDLCSKMADIAEELGVVAIGECGLDKGRGGELPEQMALFEAQLCLADDLDLPVILHQVGQQEAFLKCLLRAGIPRAGGVVHGFTGAADWGQALMKRGFHLGIGPAVLNDGRARLRNAVGLLGLDRLLIETDAPDQKPPEEETFGKLTDLALVCARVAEIKGESVEYIDECTEEGARELFRVEKLELKEKSRAESAEEIACDLDLAGFTKSASGLFLL